MSGSIKKTLLDFEQFAEFIKRSTEVEAQETESQQKERIAKLLSNWQAFCKYYFPHYCSAPFARFHIRFAEAVIENRRCYVVRQWARDHAKSVVSGLLLPAYLLLKEGKINMLICSKSYDNACELLRPLKMELESNQRLLHDFGEQRGLIWEDGSFKTKTGSFRALGAGQSPRGSRNNEARPDYILCDDIDDEEVCKNPKRLNERWDWVMGALFGSFSIKGGRFIVVNNRIAKDCIVQRSSLIPTADTQIINITDTKGKPAWKERFTPEEVKYMCNTMGYRLAQREYYNNPITEGSVFKQDGIQYKKALAPNKYQYLLCYTDPSFKSTAKNDFKATVLIGKSGTEYHIIKVFLDQTSIAQMWAWHYQVADYCTRANAAVQFYMEANFMQDLLFDDLEKEAARHGYPLAISADKRAKPDKHQRIESISPYFERGNIFFNESERDNPHQQRAVEHLLMYEKGSRTPDDFPDALEGAIFLINQKSRIANETYIIGKKTHNHKRY